MEAPAADRPAAAHTQPLTDRILSRLPGPRLAWVLAWAILEPLLVALAPKEGGILTRSEAIQVGVVFFVGTIGGFAIVRALARILSRLQPAIIRLMGAGSGERSDPFRSIRSTAGPVTLSLIIPLVYTAPGLVASPSIVGVVVLFATFVAQIPMSTLVWVCGSILVGVDRLGRQPLALAAYEEDRSLGLRQFGRVAFLSFLPVFAIGAAFIFGVESPRLEDLLLSGVLIFMMMGALLLSLYRMHRQMVAAKATYLRDIRKRVTTLLADAEAASPEHLPTLLTRLQITESRERRAQNIQEWPFDEGIQRWLVALASSVAITIFGRLVLGQLGL